MISKTYLNSCCRLVREFDVCLLYVYRVGVRVVKHTNVKATPPSRHPRGCGAAPCQHERITHTHKYTLKYIYFVGFNTTLNAEEKMCAHKSGDRFNDFVNILYAFCRVIIIICRDFRKSNLLCRTHVWDGQ